MPYKPGWTEADINDGPEIMFAWLPSIYKRFTVPTRRKGKKAYSKTLIPAIIRVGKSQYPCDVVDGLSDKTLVELRRAEISLLPERIELRLADELTFRWAQVRWHHNNHVSIKPITRWGIAAGK